MPKEGTLLSPATPIHRQLRRALEQQIRSGHFAVDDRLPSESELERRYGVSRTPVRRALQDLEAAGLIYRAQGRGSFVRSRKIGGALRDLISFGQELREAGLVVQATTLKVEQIASGPVIARHLQLTKGDPVIYLRRQYVADQEPLALFDHYLRPVLPISVLEQAGHFRSLYELLSLEGVDLWDATETIGAALATGADARLLGIKRAAPVLLMRRTSASTIGVPVEYSSYQVRADRYEYVVHLRRMT